MTPPPGAGVLAHGVGSRADLPLPLELAVAGAGAALVVSFLALGLLWREPHLDGEHAGRALPAPVQAVAGSRALRLVASAAGLLAAAYTSLALVAGPDDARNPAPWVVYVLLWVGLVPLSLLLGPTTWRRLNPMRSLHALITRAARLDPREGLWALPPGLGWWAGAAGLLAFVELELVVPGSTTRAVLAVAVLLHVSAQLGAAFAFGSRWFERGDAFEVWSGLFGRLAVLGRRPADGRLVVRSPLAGLDALRPAPGLAAAVVVMLGGTAFDSVSEHPCWLTLAQSGPLPRAVADTLGLLGVVALLGGLFAACTWAAGRLGGVGGAGMAGQFAPSIVPVALGYVVAHYASLLILEGQRAFIRLSDPLGTGADWLGTADRAVDASLVTPTGIATLQLAAVVTGHVLGVVLAHDRAVRLFPRRAAVLGQLPLLVLMVAYTCTGLLLLFAA